MSAGRRCPRCPTIITNGARYCPTCTRAYDTARGTRQARGYDANHDALRATWQARIDSGQVVRCVTCGAALAGRGWDLGHTADRTGYIGPQCVTCNRSDGGRRGAPKRA